jgi:hypothetical protein
MASHRRRSEWFDVSAVTAMTANTIHGMRAPHRSWLLPLLLGAFVFAVYIFTFPNDIQGNGDTWLRFEQTQSIVDNGTAYYSERGTPTWTDKRVVLGVGHKYVSIYDPGQIIAMIPGYEAGKLIAHRVTGDYVYTPRYTAFTIDDIFGALLVVLVFLIGVRLGYSRRTSALLGLLFAFATTAWPDAESFLEHTQVSFFLALSVLLSLTFVGGAMRKRVLLAGAGLSIGCAFLTRYDTGVLLPLIPLYVAAARMGFGSRHDASNLTDDAQMPTRKLHGRTLPSPALLRDIFADWTAYTVGLAPALACAAAWNYARFGSVTKTGIPPTFGEPILQGIAGLVLSPGKGIIWYVPLLFVLPFVVRRFYARQPLVAWFFGSIVVVEFLLFGLVIYWHGDPAYGPRYIYPTLPYLILPLGVVIERWPRLSAWPKRLFIAIVGFSVVLQLVAVITPQYRFWYKEIHAQLVARQGFNWGYKNGHFWYFYYWNVPRSPLIVDFQNAYELTALTVFGQQQYQLGVSPIPPYEHLNLANPVHNYEINNFNLWWLATQHPFLGVRADLLLAFGWVVACLVLFWYLRRTIKRTAPPHQATDW